MKLRTDQLGLLSEWINIGMGQAAAILHDMLQSPVRLQVPSVAVTRPDEAVSQLEEMGASDLSAVCMQFGGTHKGTVALMFPSQSAAALMNLLYAGEFESADMDAMKSAALTEVGNIILNSVMGNIVNLMQAHLEFSLPFYAENDATGILKFMAGSDSETHLIVARTHFEVERDSVNGCIVALFEISFLSKLGEALERYLQSV